uniref:HTH_48 domain-containing protein n=1 Tax=Heterorhabditis bacteriophora TaxID=37862 RepID=A0A1I7WRP6_HETBA
MSLISNQHIFGANIYLKQPDHINKFGTLENAPCAPRKRNTTENIEGIIRRLSDSNRRLTARDIHNEIKVRMLSECLVNSTTFRSS